MTAITLIPLKENKNQFVTEDGYFKIIKLPISKGVKIIGLGVNGKSSGEEIMLLYEEIEALYKLINE